MVHGIYSSSSKIHTLIWLKSGQPLDISETISSMFFLFFNTLVQNSGFINCCQLLVLFADCSQLRDLLIYYQEVQMVVMTVTLFHVRFNRDTTELRLHLHGHCQGKIKYQTKA